MPTTGLKLRSAAGLLVLAACFALTAAEETPFAAVSRLASGLSQGDPGLALSVFDRGMKDYGAVESAIEALTAQSEILCAIDIVEEKEQAGSRLLDADWYFELKSRAGGPPERRRERVSLVMKQTSGHWRITALTPLSILDPVLVRQ